MGRKPTRVKKEKPDKSRKKLASYIDFYEDQLIDLLEIGCVLDKQKDPSKPRISRASLLRDAADKIIIENAGLLEYEPIAVKKQKQS